MTTECAGEDLVALEPCRERDVDDRVVAGEQTRGGAFETQAQRVLLRRLAHHPRERAVEVERRPAGAGGQGIERDVRVEAAANGLAVLTDGAGVGAGDDVEVLLLG